MLQFAHVDVLVSQKLHSGKVHKLKSRDVVLCFECTCGKLCDKQGVICLKLHIDMTS